MKTMVILGAAAIAGGMMWWATRPAPSHAAAAMVQVSLPAQLSPTAQKGQIAFAANCASCHGANASGTDGSGPPLIHRVYEPGHHGDYAFVMAVRQGVRAHHWTFGDMPAVEGVSDDELGQIVTYVRELQQANGIH